MVSNAAGAVVSPGAWLVVDSGHGGGSWLRISRMSASEALLEVQVDSNATLDLLVSDDLDRWTVERRLGIKPNRYNDSILFCKRDCGTSKKVQQLCLILKPGCV